MTSAIKTNRKEDIDDYLMDIMKKSGNHIMEFSIIQILKYLHKIRLESIYSDRVEELILLLSSQIDVIHTLYYSYDLTIHPDFQYLIDDFIRLDDIDSRKYIFNNIKNDIYALDIRIQTKNNR